MVLSESCCAHRNFYKASSRAYENVCIAFKNNAISAQAVFTFKTMQDDVGKETRVNTNNV